jgi:hypothetical protein
VGGVGGNCIATKTDLNCSVESRKTSQVESVGTPELN